MTTPTYTPFDPTKPDATAQTLTQMGESMRKNLQAVRDALVVNSFIGWNMSKLGPSFTASISGTVMTVSAVASGTLAVGQTIFGAGVASDTTIVSLGTGTGGVGTYNISAAHTIASEAMSSVTADQPENALRTKGTEMLLAAITWGTSGGADGNPVQITYAWSNDSGASWSSIGTVSIAYDARGNPSTTTWS